MRVNIDLTKTNSNNDIVDEQYTDVGSSAFNLVHDFFYGSTDLEIWTGAGQTGTQLTETTDYTLAGINTDLTTRAGVNIYSTVQVTNVTYQTGSLYITYHACADFVDAVDIVNIENTSGDITFLDQYVVSAIPFSETGETGLDTTATSIVGAINELVASGGGSLDDAYNLGSAVTVDTTDVTWNLSASRLFRLYDAFDSNKFEVTSGTSATSVKIETTGGIDIDAEVILDLACGGGYIDISGAGLIAMAATGNQNITLTTSGSGDIVLTSADTVDINSAILDIDVTASSAFTATGIGAGIEIKSVIGAAGTGGNLTLQTQTTDAGGTSGNVIIGQASGPGPAGNIQITTENNTTAAIDINATDGGIDIDSDSFALNTATGNIVINSAGTIDIDSDGVIDLNTNSNSMIINCNLFDLNSGNVDIDSSGTFSFASAFNSNNAFQVTLTGGGAFNLNATTALGDSNRDAFVRVFGNNNTGGDLTVATAATSGGTAGNLYLQSTVLDTGTAGTVTITSENTGVSALDINATDGGIDIDAELGVTITDTFTGTGTGNGVTITSDVNNSGQLAGDVTIESKVTSGISGKVVVKSASVSSNSIDIDVTSASGGIDIDVGSGPISISGTNTSAGIANNITIETDVNNASGTGGNIVLQATATSGTAGYVSLLGDVRMPTSAPSSPAAGSYYFNSGTDTLFIHNGTGWVSTTLT